MKVGSKLVIGRSEWIDFPDLQITKINAKIDTGAYTTALHCHSIYVKNNILYFKVLDPYHPGYNEQEYSFDTFSEKRIKNSFGEVEYRYIVKTKIRIGKRSINTLISLTNRGNMRYPVLIGRKFLKDRFIVDVSLKNATKNK